jgi:hypothetical protein
MDSKELRNLHEAYMDVYEQEEMIDEAEVMRHQQERDRIEGNKAREDDRIKKARSKYGKERRYFPPTKGVHGEIERRQAQKPPSKLRSGSLPESYDLYDIILSHLIDEGYAATEESALAIMINMSEEWREDIMEISRKTATSAYAKSATGEFEGADDESDIKRTDRLRGHIERKFGKKAAEDADRHADSETFGRKDPRTGKRQPKPESRFQNPNKYRTRSDGKMHGQDQNKLKSKLERARAQKESFNIFVNSMIAEGVSMEQYTWEEIQNVFDDLFEAQVANRNPDEYESKEKQGQSREQQLKGRVMGRMSQMDPDKKAAMLKQMRAVGLDV